MKKKIIYMSNFTKFLIEDSLPYIKSCLSEFPPDQYTVDIGCVTIVKSGTYVIAELESMGYEVVDTRDAVRDAYIKENSARKAINTQPCTMIHNLLNELSDVPKFLEELSTDTIYRISGTNLFPLVLVANIVRPEIKFSLEHCTSEFGKYVATSLYSTKNVPDFHKFKRIITGSDEMNYYFNNDILTTALVYNAKTDSVFVSELQQEIELDTLFKSHAILPVEFGCKNLQRDENWAPILKRRVNQCIVKRKQTVSLNSILQLEEELVNA